MSDPAPHPSHGSTRHLDELRAEARYHRERHDLYRAKAYGGRPTTTARMLELQRAAAGAEARLFAAERAVTAPSAGPS